ncbi:urea transporter [Plesiomonas shigelloides]|nr:urea transporter [Plesiomonas shigelloides]
MLDRSFCRQCHHWHFFLLAIAFAALQNGTPYTILGAIVGLTVSTLMATRLHLDDNDIAQGLHGFNGILVGITVTTFFIPSPLMWVLLISGAMLCPIAECAIKQSVTRSWGVPGSTLPFVLISWMLLLAGYNLSGCICMCYPPRCSIPMKATSLC